MDNKEIFNKYEVTQLTPKPIDFILLKEKLAEAISHIIVPIR